MYDYSDIWYSNNVEDLEASEHPTRLPDETDDEYEDRFKWSTHYLDD